MKLFKLPYLCQKEVFNEMSFSTRYIFTFGTRRMKIWAKHFQKSSKKSPELQMKFGDAAGVFIGHVAFLVKSGKQTEKIMDVVCRRVNTKISRVMKISDFEFDCDVTFPPNVLFKYKNKKSPATWILDSLCEFFNTTKEDVVYIFHHELNFYYLPPIPVRKSVIRVTNPLPNSDLMKDFYSHYPSRQFSMISVFFSVVFNEGGRTRAFHWVFPALRVHNLIVLGLEHVDVRLLERFQGENAVFSGTRILTFAINQFLRIWLRGNLDDLKTMIVEVTDPIQGNDIFEGIPHTREQERVMYPYSSMIQDYHDFPEDAFDCFNTFSITRHAGTPIEKKATVKMTANSFMFFVWD